MNLVPTHYLLSSTMPELTLFAPRSSSDIVLNPKLSRAQAWGLEGPLRVWGEEGKSGGTESFCLHPLHKKSCVAQIPGHNTHHVGREESSSLKPLNVTISSPNLLTSTFLRGTGMGRQTPPAI